MEPNGVDVLGAVLERRYRVDAPLARGGMSSVYRGVDLRLDRPVAIKVMESKFVGDRSFIDRFELEARAAARLHHPNVVAVHDQGVDGDHVYLVMELVDGGTLRDLVREQGRLAPALAISVLDPVLSALGAAHRAGLVHRDVKPENVLIGQGGTVKVADFGLVRAMAGAGITSDSMILGTVAYLSPEQVTTGAADARSDVYSAGVMLYEMLTGVPPYQGDTPISVAYRHVNDDVPPPSELVSDIPPALDDLVLRATRRDPELRPGDASAFLLALSQTRDALGVRRMPVPVPTPPAVEPEGSAVSRRGRHAVPADEAGGSGVLELPDDDGPEAEVPVDDPTVAAPRHDRTVLTSPVTGAVPEPSLAETTIRTSPVPPGPVGPQGTRAMSRADLGQLAMPGPVAQQPPPQQQQRPPRPGRAASHRPAAPAQAPYQQQRRRSRRVFAIWIAIVLVIAAVVGLIAWWLGSGRWTTVPSVIGQDATTAEHTLNASDLSANVVQQRSNNVPAGQVASTDPGTGARALRGSTVTIVVSEGKPIVPDFVPGATPSAVEQAIKAAGLTPQTDDKQNAYDDKVPTGTVLRLNPAPGTPMNLGAAVTVVLSKGPAPKPVPPVVGQPHDQAFAALTQAGFQPYDEPATFDPSVPTPTVIRTDPPAGTVIAPGADHKVGVLISNAISLPNFTGQDAQQALQTLQQLGLQAQVQSIIGGGNGGQVFNQSPAPGTLVAPGSAVVIGVVP